MVTPARKRNGWPPDLAALPQGCLRSDRMSVLESVSLRRDEALANEFRHGMTVLAGSAAAVGVSRFREGAGRGGAAVAD